MRRLAIAAIAVAMLVSAFAGTVLAKTWAVGDQVEVEWKSAWYKAKILEVKDDQYKITYVGWDAKWDEWVTDKRIRPLVGWKVGDELEVEWKGTWYASKIIEVKDDQYKITYIGWDSKWDEWVTVKRMRAAATK